MDSHGDCGVWQSRRGVGLSVGSSMTSIATIEAAFQFLDLPMPCPDISIKPENEPPSWIFVFGDKMTKWGRSGHLYRAKGPILPIDGLRSKGFHHRGAPEPRAPIPDRGGKPRHLPHLAQQRQGAQSDDSQTSQSVL